MEHPKRTITTKILIILFSLLVIIALILNIFSVFIWAKGDATKSSLIATVISGWVSGIATLVVGIIALLQTKKYNELNDQFVKKQYVLDQCKNILQARLLFVDNLKSAGEKYMSTCNPVFMELELNNIINNPNGEHSYIKARKCITDYFVKLKIATSELLHIAELDYHNSMQRNAFLDNVNKYFVSFSELVNTEEKIDDASLHLKKFEKTLLDEKKINDLYSSTESSLSKYIVNADMDIFEAVFDRNDDIDYLKKMFSPRNKDSFWDNSASNNI